MTARSVEAMLEYLSDGGTPSNLDRDDIEALVNRINRLQSRARAAEEGAAAGMTAIDDRATALILRDQVKHLENALREAGNLARALEQQVKELKVEVSWLKRYHVCKMDRTGPDTLFCYGCRTEMNEPEDK